MTIAHITGGPGVGKTFMGQMLRGQAVNSKRGTLFVDDSLKDDGATQHLIEKLIQDGSPEELGGKIGRLSDVFGNPLKTSFDINEINWKPAPVISFVGDAIDRLKEIEAMVPGFTEKFGPVRELPLGNEPYSGEPPPEIVNEVAEFDLPLEQQVLPTADDQAKRIAELEAQIASIRAEPVAPASGT